MGIRKAALALLLLSQSGWAQGGPPLVTDDPGTPGPGNLEFNIAAISEISSDQKLLRTPYVDANFGVGERIQLKFETGWAFAYGSEGPVHTGGATALAGVKWRFVDQERAGISLSTYPQYGFHHFFSRKDPLINPPGNHFFIPIEAAKEIGRWGVNPEIGYDVVTQGTNEWIFGLAGSYQPREDFELLAEIHATTAFDSNGAESLIDVGTRYPFSKTWRLLFAIGHSLTHFEDERPVLFCYLGMQLRL